MEKLGPTEQFIQESKQYKDLFIGRVSSQTKNVYKVITKNGEILAEISGKFYFSVKNSSELPFVGDFVMIDRIDNYQGNAIINHVLTRKSILAHIITGMREDVYNVATINDMKNIYTI